MDFVENIRQRAIGETLVLLEEEYGYRSWFWFPGMPTQELKDWWVVLETVAPYFMTPEPLPGDLYQVNENSVTLFRELKEKGTYITGHIHSDDDSFLILPGGERVLHAGFEPT